MTTRESAVAAAMLSILAVQSVSLAQPTTVVGYNRFTAAPLTDVLVTLPFNQAVDGNFAVSGKSGAIISVTDTLTAGLYANVDYVRFTSGGAAGLWSTVTANGIHDITIADLAVANLVNNGDTFRLYKHYTLSSMFPKRMMGVSHLSGTKILIYDNNLAAMGQNKSASKIATCAATGAWVGSGVDGNTILKPETQFILRNTSASQTLTVTTFGTVPDYSVRMLIAAGGDLVIGSGYPVPVVLKNAGLNGTNRKILFFDNTATGQNKSAQKIATCTAGGAWVGSGITGNELIPASAAVVLRLPPTEIGTMVTITKPY